MPETVLIADDDPISRKALHSALTHGQYSVIEAINGTEALQHLSGPHAPALAILDWMMPGLDGPDVCRIIRTTRGAQATYLMLLTSKSSPDDIVIGLEAGADDYIVKPFDSEELRARVRVGFRVLRLQEGLARRVAELEQALGQIRNLQGLLPICSYCKKIRDDRNYWRQVEEYISAHSDVQFSHGICPHCYQNEVLPQITSLRLERGKA